LNGHRDWVRDRRARTRLLIEYGGLLVKAGLPERVEDDRATLLGALLMIRDQLEGLGDDSPTDLKARWRRRGLRAFDADAAAQAEGKRKEAAMSITE
jgi:Conjugal transfer protein TraD